MAIRGALLDWDGTVIDSHKPVSLPRLMKVLASYGYELDDAAMARVHERWGRGGATFIAHVLGVDEVRGAELFKAWEDYDNADPQQFIPKSIEAIELLHGRGVKFGIASSRSRASISTWFPRAPIFSEFVSITGREDVTRLKPEPEALEPGLAAFAKLGIGKHECILVGDTESDIRAAQAAGIRVVVVETGPYWENDAANNPVDARDIIPSLAHLPRWMEEHGV